MMTVQDALQKISGDILKKMGKEPGAEIEIDRIYMPVNFILRDKKTGFTNESSAFRMIEVQGLGTKDQRISFPINHAVANAIEQQRREEAAMRQQMGNRPPTIADNPKRQKQSNSKKGKKP